VSDNDNVQAQPQTYTHTVYSRYCRLPPIHVVWNHAASDKLTVANGGTFTSSSACLSSHSR